MDCNKPLFMQSFFGYFLFLQKLTPKKVSPRKFYWKTLFPSGTAAEENAEVLYSTKLVLITSENAPTIDEFNKGGILMDFKRVYFEGGK